ncbi:MAG: transposase [Candidatus Eiseniibacteriota bacterium]
MAKKAKRRRYTVAEKRRILALAAKEGLTGAQVQKKFGIAQLTFYRWRGPVRRRRGRARAAGAGAGPMVRAAALRLGSIRDEVRSGVRRLIPDIIREEVSAYLSEILGGSRRRGRKPGPQPGRRRRRRGPGRPRKGT